MILPPVHMTALAGVVAFAVMYLPPPNAVTRLLYTTSASAHESWISKDRLIDPASGEWCCNRNDCRAEQVRETGGGYLVETGEIIPYARVLWRSPDGAWWRCRIMGGEKIGQTRCLIGPMPSS